MTPADLAATVFDRRQLIAGVLVLAVLTLWAILAPGPALSSLAAATNSPWFPLLLVGLYLLRPVVAWPITVLSAVVGFEYGIVLGVPIALVGAVATSLIPYAVARYLRTDSGWVGRVTRGSTTYFRTAGDLRGVTAARLAPTPAEAISAGAGVAAVPIPAFVAGTLLGELPWTIAAVTVGASLDSARGIDNLQFDPLLVTGAVLAAALLLAGPLYRRLTTHTENPRH